MSMRLESRQPLQELAERRQSFAFQPTQGLPPLLVHQAHQLQRGHVLRTTTESVSLRLRGELAQHLHPIFLCHRVHHQRHAVHLLIHRSDLHSSLHAVHRSSPHVALLSTVHETRRRFSEQNLLLHLPDPEHLHNAPMHRIDIITSRLVRCCFRLRILSTGS